MGVTGTFIHAGASHGNTEIAAACSAYPCFPGLIGADTANKNSAAASRAISVKVNVKSLIVIISVASPSHTLITIRPIMPAFRQINASERGKRAVGLVGTAARSGRTNISPTTGVAIHPSLICLIIGLY